MINAALGFVREALDRYLVNKFDMDAGVAVLNGVDEKDGDGARKNANKIVMTLVNLEYETSKQFYGGQRREEHGDFATQNPPVRFNVDVLFTANFDEYEEALKFITATIGYFQASHSFNPQTNPDLPGGIEKLTMEIENVDLLQTHDLWSSLGTNYKPSIIYKLRHVTIQLDEIKHRVSAVDGVRSRVGGRV